MRTDIKFAGIGVSWSEEQAKKRNILYQEIGFLTKIIDFQEAFVVAYSHKDFTAWEAIHILYQIDKGNNLEVE